MSTMETKNTSGHGDFSQVPSELKGWNWGAFWLTWIWGIGNRSYIALLCLLPIVNIIMPFYLGAKGNRLAWCNKEWYSIEEFKDTQKKWSKWGWIVGIIVVSIFISSLVEDYKLQKHCQDISTQVITQLEENKQVKELLGKDYKVLSGPSLISIHTNIGKQIVGGTMIIQGMDEILFVNLDIDNSYLIKKITVSFGDHIPGDEIEIYP